MMSGAIVLYGVKIKRDLLTVTRKVKVGVHNYPEDYIYDPKTGKPLWKETEGYPDCFDRRYDRFADEYVVWDNEDSEYVFVGNRISMISANENDGEQFTLCDDYLDGILAGLSRSFLKYNLKDLWDKSDHGLFLIPM